MCSSLARVLHSESFSKFFIELGHQLNLQFATNSGGMLEKRAQLGKFVPGTFSTRNIAFAGMHELCHVFLGQFSLARALISSLAKANSL